MFKLERKLWGYITIRRKWQYLLVLLLMIVSSLSEIISIGAIIPFLGVISNPEQIYQHSMAQPIIGIFDLTSPNQLILPSTILFILATAFSGIVRTALLYTMTKLSFATGSDLSIDIYNRSLYQDYYAHLTHNSSKTIDIIVNKTNLVTHGVLLPMLTLISTSILSVGIIVVFFLANPKIASIMIISFSLLYLIITQLTRDQLKHNSKLISKHSNLMVKSIQEGLGGIRDILIDNNQQFFSNIYKKSDILFRRALSDNVFIGAVPRYIMESAGMIVIVILAYILVKSEESDLIIPILGVLALGLQRLLPALQQFYSAYSGITGSQAPLEDVVKSLGILPSYHVNKSNKNYVSFNHEINLENFWFQYTSNDPWVLRELNLKIPKGSCIGFIGETGSGKSTLLDIIMGLLVKTKGDLAVDGISITRDNVKSWQEHISHVPQSIYLSDSSIKENIAFGITKEEINEAQVRRVSKQAKIDTFVDELTDGYETIIGEGGVRLSGGQRQRLGIARALYRDSDVLIFDEATSALDVDTEKDIMKTINDLKDNMTILMIAHRVSSLKGCDKIVRVRRGGDLEIMDYNDIADFQ